jgi:UDP-glucuronate 4-epimerase
MNILVTGAAGFIGYNFIKQLQNNKKIKIIGIDIFEDYYDVNLKKKRILDLKKNRNFNFFKINIHKEKDVFNLFKKNKFNIVYNFAAQAGVRYSIENPRKYIENNINGFFNIIENCRKFKIERLFFASSSSVYGENKNFPLNEKEKIYPKNIYALSKKNNEEVASLYEKYYGLKSTALRFFTVYGEWGRPDMFIMKYMDSYRRKKTFYLNNFGDHLRDFTYIKDVTKILESMLKKRKSLNKFDIFNICSNKPINLGRVIAFMSKNKIKPKVKKVGLQQADIYKTHGNNSKIIRFTKFKKFTNLEYGLSQTLLWYKQYHRLKK